jgi:hypothetical protein
MHRFFIVYTALIAIGLGIFLRYAYIRMSEAQWLSLSAEHGLLEMATAILFGVVAMLAFVVFIKKGYMIWLYFTALMGLACARELDLHKAWTTDSILKSNFYQNAGIPIIEKIVGAIIILALLFLAYQMIKRVPTWVKALLEFKAPAWTVGFGLGALVVGKSLDSMARWFPFMADFKNTNAAYLGVVEESLEMSAALFFLSVCLMGFKRHFP